jgi:hypothetical protein
MCQVPSETTACRSCDGLTATAVTGRCVTEPGPDLTCMRAVQITRFGGPEVQELVDVLQPEAGPAQQLYDVSTAGVNYADTHPRRDRFQSPSGSSPSITRPGSAPGGFSRRRSRPATADRIGGQSTWARQPWNRHPDGGQRRRASVPTRDEPGMAAPAVRPVDPAARGPPSAARPGRPPPHDWIARRAHRHELTRENVGGGIPDLLRRAGFTDVSETGSDVRRHVGRFTSYRAVA